MQVRKNAPVVTRGMLSGQMGCILGLSNPSHAVRSDGSILGLSNTIHRAPRVAHSGSMHRTLNESDDESDAGTEGAPLPGSFAAPTFTQQYDPETKVRAAVVPPSVAA